MHYGLYKSSSTPWAMDCTTVHPFHCPWVMYHSRHTFLLYSEGCRWPFTLNTLYKGEIPHECSSTLNLETLYPCDLGKLNFSYPCPPIPPICLSCSISPMSWLFIPHLPSPYHPDTSHVSKGPNHPFHLLCNNFSLFTPPLCSCPCSQPVHPINCVSSVLV
jgi:hypothetical protein